MFSLFVDVNGIQDKYETQHVYEYGHVTYAVKEGYVGELDKMIIDNAFPIDLKKRVTVSYYTKYDQTVDSYITNHYGEKTQEEINRSKQFDIGRPHIIYDKEVLKVTESGTLIHDLKIGWVKREIT